MTFAKFFIPFSILSMLLLTQAPALSKSSQYFSYGQSHNLGRFSAAKQQLYTFAWITPKYRKESLYNYNEKVQKLIDKQVKKKSDKPSLLKKELEETKYQKISLKPWDNSKDLMLITIPTMKLDKRQNAIYYLSNEYPMNNVSIIDKKNLKPVCSPVTSFKISSDDLRYIQILYGAARNPSLNPFSSKSNLFDSKNPSLVQTYDAECIVKHDKAAEALVSHSSGNSSKGKIQINVIKKDFSL